MPKLPKPPNPSRHHLRIKLEAFAKSLSPGSQVLDIGAGSALYAPIFAEMTYRASDFRQNKHGTIDLVGDMTSIELPDGSIDAIVCTQAIHASPNPVEVLAEFKRLLAPTGRCFVSTVFAYPPVDEPYDCFRITPHGMEAIAQRAGLVIESAEPMEGYYGTLSNQTLYASQQLPRRFIPLRAIFWLVSHSLARADVASPRHDIGHPKNYVFVLRNSPV